MMRQAPTSFRPSQRQNHPNNKRKPTQGVRTTTVVLTGIILFVVTIIFMIPNDYISVPRSMWGKDVQTGLRSILSEESRSRTPPFPVIENKNMPTITERFPSVAANKEGSLVISSQKEKEITEKKEGEIVSIKEKRRRIAYVITITKDGHFQDGAAVLAYSIYKVSQLGNDDVSLISFVHPSVSTSRPILAKLGYHVIEVPTPINSSAIKFEFLRTKIDKNGCCGAAELIKLNSYRLTQYDWVVHLDADTFLANPITELFAMNYSLIYTTDPNMASFKMETSMPAQGGFLVLKPSVPDYESLIDLVMTKEFKVGGGWDGSKIGWFWGGMTVQGILPYYYNLIAKPFRSLKVNRCIYNTMADTDACTVQTLQEIKSAHFTVCQKPWTCYPSYVNPLCKKLHDRWFELRLATESFYGMPQNLAPCTGKRGGRKYQEMNMEQASMPVLSVLSGSNYSMRPDDSPDRIVPIGNSGYISDQYH